MKKMFQRKWVILLILVLIFVGGYFGYQKLTKKGNAPRYVTATVEKGTLILSVSGSGQILALDEFDIKPKVSGDLVKVNVEKGKEVKAGEVLFEIDDKDAKRAVSDAEANLESAKSSLENLKLNREQQLRLLEKTYQEGMDTLADFYDQFPTIMDNLKSVFFRTDLTSPVSQNCNLDYLLLSDCNITYYASYSTLKEKFSKVPEEIATLYLEIENLSKEGKSHYQNVKRTGGEERFLAIEEGKEIAQKTAEMIKIGRDVLSSFEDLISEITKSGGNFTKKEIVEKHSSILATSSEKITNFANNLLSITNSIQNYKNSIKTIELNIKDQERAIKEKEENLLEAKEKLSDYSIKAPFDGIVAALNVKNGDSVSPQTTMATLITKEKIAQITLNEIDAAKVKVGQKANVTFDAIEGLNITGKVIEIDPVGQVSQGVVSFGVKIALDTDDERIKPGMSISATIITQVKPNVLLVPNSAIKREGEMTFVQLVVDKGEIKNQEVKVGLSNETMTEIVEGLKEGELVISQIITQSTRQTQRNQGFTPSMMRMMR